MDQLPAEILSYLCGFLSQSSLKTFRLLRKSFAIVGAVFLFEDFKFKLYPNSHRLSLFEQLANNANIASRLKCLSLESGIQLEYADYKYWAANVYQDISGQWSRSLGAEGSAQDDYEKFHADLQARFTSDMPRRYERYRWHLDEEAGYMATEQVRERLARSMTSLNLVNQQYELELVMAEPQISLEDLEQFQIEDCAMDMLKEMNPRRRVTNRRRSCLYHFHYFLEAASRSACNIRKLTAIALPQQLLNIDHLQNLPVLQAIFHELHTVDIQMGSFPYSDWLSRGGLSEIYTGGRNIASRQLSTLLNQPTDLQSLRLEFPEGKEAEYSFDIFDRTNIDRFPRLWLPRLRDLDLCHILCRWDDMRAFLQTAKTLKSLKLSHCRLETGSLIDVIRFLPSMSLEHLGILGTWSVDEDAGQWHAHSKDDFSNCIAATSYDGPYAESGFRHQIESFALSGGSCPLPAWTEGGAEERIWELSGDTSWHYIPSTRRW